MDGHKVKKQTKKQMIESIPKYVENTLKEGRLLNMTQGGQVAQQMILDYINSGHNLDEVKSFIEKNLSPSGIDAMDRVVKPKEI